MPQTLDLVITPTHPNGTIEEGKFAFNSELHCVLLTQGSIEQPDGTFQKGKFSYIPELHQICIVEGYVISPDGKIESGSFVYDQRLNSMRLEKGKVLHPDLKFETGTFEYIPELQRCELVEGRTEKGDNWQEGTRKYIPELGRMHLIEGSISKNGVIKSGTLVYDSSLANGVGGMRFIQKLEIPNEQINQNSELIANISEMTNLFGDSKAMSNLNNLLNAWESLNQTTAPQAYAEKVDQLSEAYHQCKRTLLICVHPDRGGATETAQRYIEPLQNLGRSINNTINTLRNSEPNFV